MRGRRMPMTAEKATEQTMVLFLIMRAIAVPYSCGAKRFGFGILVGILLSFVHLFLERLGLLFVDKRQPRKAFFKLKRVEEYAILVVLKTIIDLLIPYYSAVCRLFLSA
jgi:hypothetical protein